MKDEQERSKFLHHLPYLASDLRYPMPYIQFAGTPYGEHPDFPGVKFDALGFRNDVLPPTSATSSQVRRVFVVGDSTVVAGRDRDDTICGRLARELDELGLNAEIYNFGVTSTIISQMSHLIWGKLLAFRPDQIIVVAGGPDMFVPWTYDPRSGYPYNFFALEEVYNRLFGTEAIASPPAQLCFQDMIEAIVEFQSKLRRSEGWKSADWATRIIEQFSASLAQLQNMSEAYRIPMIVYLQPLVVTKRCLHEREANMLGEYFNKYLIDQYDALRKMFERSENGYYYKPRDLSRVFDGQTCQIFSDFIHYNEQGRELVAQAIARDIALSSAPSKARRIVAAIWRIVREI